MSGKWNKNYIKFGVVLTVSLCICIIFGELIQQWKSIIAVIGRFISALTPVIIGLVLAFLLNPIMIYIRRGLSYLLCRLVKKHRYETWYRKVKAVSLIITIVLFLGMLVGFFWLVIPHIYESIKQVVADTPKYLEEVQNWAAKMFKENKTLEGIVNSGVTYVQENVMTYFEQKIIPNMDTIVLKISSGVVVGVKAILNFLLGLIVAVYLLASKDTLLAQGKKIVYCIFPKKAGNKILSGLNYANSVFGGFINGKILDSFIIGIMCYVFTAALGMQYAVLISVIVGITNIVPFFGPFIGAVPGSLLALMDDPFMFVIFVIFILVLQQFDGNILGPLILGDSTGISGIWVMFAILVGGNLFGVMGMILGIPVFACIYAFIAVTLRDSLRAKNLSSATEDYIRLAGFDEETGEPFYHDKIEGRTTLKQKKKRRKKLNRQLLKHDKNTKKADDDSVNDKEE